jgi:methylmalonyl-CoA mutase N-terminal domain/subunit
LRAQLDILLDVQINPKQRKTVREETEEFIAEGLSNLKARLKKSGLENEEIEARVLKFLAEAEEARARAATERQMTEKQRMKNQANQLRLLIRAEIAMTSGEISDLLEVLDELGRD